MTRSGQIPLRFPEQTLSFEEMSITPANRGVVAAVRRVEHWPYQVFCVVGPKQCGLSTLAAAWAKERGGVLLSADEFSRLGSDQVDELASNDLAIDRADDIELEGQLLRAISAFGRLGGHLLLTARLAPANWRSSTPDLASRLIAAPIADLGAPDEALMRGRIKRACARAYLVLPKAVEDYLVIRLGLNFETIEDAVTRLDGAATDRPLSVPLAREVLHDSEQTGELFERDKGE